MNLPDSLPELPNEFISILQKTKGSQSKRYESHYRSHPCNIDEALSYLDPDMAYEEWVKVGMALHESGCDVAIWEAWSSRGNKFKPNECLNKWNGFNKGGGVGIGTIIHMAKERGYRGEFRMDNNTNTKHGTKSPPEPLKAYSLNDLIADTSPMPDDLISPRLLTPKGLLLFAGAPKVGKSDFILSLLLHAASGESFLGFTFPKPMNIFYLQCEVQYHYLRERIQMLGLPDVMLRAVTCPL